MKNRLVEIFLNDLIKTYSLASVGRLMNGLVHNLNGPLQNLGIDMEMLNHSLLDHGDIEDEFIKKMHGRIKRMEGEFERINNLIRLTSTRGELENASHGGPDLKEFIEQEISFLNANLYFKHNVEKDLQMADNLPSLARLPEGIIPFLSWFIHGLVDELEREKIRTLALSIHSDQTGTKIVMSAKGSPLSSEFIELLSYDDATTETLRFDKPNVGMALALVGLKSLGVTVSNRIDPPQSDIVLTIPTRN